MASTVSPQPVQNDRLYRIRELTERTGVNAKLIRLWIAEGQLRAYRPNSNASFLVSGADFNSFLRSVATIPETA